ncbi:flavodoxin domain-containing protein [Stenotrophomonas sp. CFBP 13718]|uniref:sulfite reductase subunit alpha n=1 Tax=Stenotrophomonas sp. CFBP 13718 TaxID=2775304 RepID=UPI001786FFCD|nr:flavodoxin domain-containing protein [Stenotrophomonas sp. CFBP 13718]MBD8695304.1 flavodoxin domain-containing protein [Stenotrophomonas sp. CFBP 13718]
MNLRPSRALLGNVLVIGALLLIAALLLRLHVDDSGWQVAPRPRDWLWAVTSLLAYVGLCGVLWWRTRPRIERVDPSQRPVLVVWASQTGFALQLAERTADALRSAGLAVRLRSIEALDATLLAQSDRVLFVASTTGEGDPPDHAAPFLQHMDQPMPSLAHLQYGVLALGDRSYDHYCAFGHQLDGWLRRHGARAMFDTVEVNNADPASLRHWQQLLGQLGGAPTEQPDWTAIDYQPWTLVQRERLNPGSVGGPVHWLRLRPPVDQADVRWQAGDIAEIGPRHAPAVVDAWLRSHALDGDARLDDGQTLHQHLSRSHLPGVTAGGDLPTLLSLLQPLPHREYSIASAAHEDAVDLVLRRQVRDDGTPGIGSGWLCDIAQLGDTIDLRVRRNPNFHGVAADVPLILIGNGTGIAGLRAHLRERDAAGASRNWLLFGERSAAHDFHFRTELEQMQQRGMLERLDAVFSRDGAPHRYVQHRLQAEAPLLRRWVDDGATILVCGSLQGMAPAVDAVIEEVVGAERKDALVVAGRYRRDVY